MLTVYGVSDTDESSAAKNLANAISIAWPWLAASDSSTIGIIPNVQCFGQRTRDLDLVLLADIAEADLSLAVFRPTSRSSRIANLSLETTTIRVRSLCLVVEIKDHPQQSIQFTGGRVSVFYKKDRKWHDATGQSEKQKYSLKGYIEQHNATAPRITNLIWLRNVDKHSLPDAVSNLIPSAITWTGLLNIVLENHAPRNEAGSLVIDHHSLSGTWSIRDCETILAKRQEPTALDRRRVEAICRVSVDDDAVSSLAGRRMVLLSGRGGTGKTIILLRLAYKQSLAGARALLLTYNLALKADLERLLTLTGIRDDIASGTVQVRTVQSFTLQILKLIGVVDERGPDDFLEDYESYLASALQYLDAGAITREEAASQLSLRPDEFDWDLLLLDEAQDWPDRERDLLLALFSPSRFVIADGRDQLVRQGRNCDWKAGMRKDEFSLVQCVRSFRMKRNLANFANHAAACLGLPFWQVDENGDLPGGEVIVIEGDYFADSEVHNSLVQECLRLGNMPIDMLACAPSIGIGGRHANGPVSTKFRALGQEVWDGTDAQVRRSPPNALSQLRVVNYDSCRGLEGWTTIHLGFDVFYEDKLALALSAAVASTEDVPDRAQAATRFAAAWAMIALTRAIDTLVIVVSPDESVAKAALRSVYERESVDYMNWIVVQESTSQL